MSTNPHLFKPGHPGGPGRPRKRPMTDRYFELAETPFPEKMRKALERQLGVPVPHGATWADAWALASGIAALSGKSHGTLARKEMADRMEGKAAQRVEISGPENRSIQIAVVYEEPVQPRILDAQATIVGDDQGAIADGNSTDSATPPGDVSGKTEKS